MIIVFAFLAYLVLVAAVTAGLVALSRRLCRKGDEERAAEAAEFAASLLAGSGRAPLASAAVREAGRTVNAATAHTANAGTDWLSVLLGYWWLALIFGGAVLEWIGETFDVGLSALYRRAELRHQRQMDLKRVELEILQAKTGTAPSSLPAPGPCVHRNVRPVISADDELVGWLCACDTQLPPDWAVREEDL